MGNIHSFYRTFSTMFLLTTMVVAQSGGDFVVTQSVIAGGGGSSRGGSFAVESTLGQTFGGSFSEGGTFTIGSGYWAFSADASPSPTPAIGGTVTYANAIGSPNPRYVSNVTITGAGSPNVVTTTDAPGATAGQYLLTGFGSGSYTVTPSKTGAFNGVTSFDAARVSQHVTGANALTGNQLIVAEVSGNGVISSFDAAQIARFVIGAPPFGSAGVWRFAPVNRSYASVTTNVAGEDYGALLMGEVSGNWANTGARGVVSGQWPVVSDGEERIVVHVASVTAAANSETVVSINVSGVTDKDVIAYEFDLRYDPAVIQPISRAADVTATVSHGLTAVVNAEEPGLLRVAVYGVEQIKRDGVLLNLRFTTVGVPGWVSPLVFEKLMFNEGDSQVTLTNGRVEISAE